ncbi:GNAT family N-acetyltransferase [Lignipirellula cremea]|uniref:BioF2-like acetyltransferase domain-containing protein n=1 Tax=Lignipirellula cremea TaxID=2528010 RepID=A0A518DU63_9BACT|nr:GNAT family N-acetyltransferase [Lignipirellula cremea]QDU95380.1 hypothetical protein Pla8534_31950 [Lignipirellula cremea]
MRLIQYRNAAEFSAAADKWDDLWTRSACAVPAVRSAIISDWLLQFSQPGKFKAFAVEDSEGRLLAALPLAARKLGGVVEVAGLTSNPWAPCGDLLLDETTDTDAVLDLLAPCIHQAPGALGWFDGVAIDTPRWVGFQNALRRAGMSFDVRESCLVGVVPVTGNWDAYRKTWSKNFRQVVGRRVRRFREDENRTFRIQHSFSPAEVRPLLERGFEVEDRCWKGEAGSSIVRSPGMAAYLIRQSEQLAAWGQLTLAFLEEKGRPFAFELGWTAKGVHHPFKVAYDEEFKSCGPGQLLLHEVIEHFFHDDQVHAIDFTGPLQSYTDRWRPEPYRLGRIVVSPRQLLGKTMYFGYKHVWGSYRKFKNRNQVTVSEASSL